MGKNYPKIILILSNNSPTPKLDQRTNNPNTIKIKEGIVQPVFCWNTNRKGG